MACRRKKISRLVAVRPLHEDMDKSKDITVVIPAYNRGRLIGRTLDSIARQTMQPAGVILVDNGSDDDTLAVMREWASGREGVQVVEEPRRGACAARNAGLGLVETRYVMFFDSDDEMLPGHIAEFQRAIGRYPDCGILGRDVENRDEAGHCRRFYFSELSPIFMHIFRSTLGTQRYVVLTELVRSAGGWDESLSGWDDYELGLRLLLHEPRVKDIGGRPTVINYTHGESITGLSHREHPERWEPALELMHRLVDRSGLSERRKRKVHRWISARTAILAARYSCEGYDEGARRCLAKACERGAARRMRLVYHHNRLCGRLSWLVVAIML